MNQAPGDRSGLDSRLGIGAVAQSRAYRRPWLALAIAGIAVAATLVVILILPAIHERLSSVPGWVVRMTDLVVLSAPLLLGVGLAGMLAADGIRRATGIRRWRWTDAALGVCVGLITRALTELVAPTAGRLLGPFDVELTADVLVGAAVLVAGVVLITPVVEELFFRGVIVRALSDALTGAGRAIAGTVAVAVSTAVFVMLHIAPSGAGVPLGVVVGTSAVGVGCGILTLVTGRLGGAIVAHVAFNAIGVALLLW